MNPPGATLTDLLAVHGSSGTQGHVGAASPEQLLEEFATWAAANGLPLYPAQEDALLELAAGSHVILATPTGSGKSLVAVGAMFFALAQGRRTYYTAPIKALVSEKFFDLCDLLGPARVGMITGDAAVNPDAPVICATAEILANLALRQGSAALVDVVCMDEFHYYGDRDRGWAWQVPLIELTGAQFLLMSATLGDMRRIRDDLTRRTGQPAALVTGGERPVPLDLLLRADPDPRDDRGAAGVRSRPHLRRPPHAGPRTRARPGPDEPECVHARGEGRDRRGDRRLPVHRRLRSHADPAGAPRDRGPPRGDAAPLPAPGRAADPGRAAQGGLRDRHPGRRDQRPDPHRPDHVAGQVRRPPAAGPAGTGVPPDRRARWPCRVRRRGFGRGAGAGARDREPPAGRQGRRRPQEAAPDRAEEAAGGPDVEPVHLRQAGGCRARAAALPVRRDPRDGAQSRAPAGGC